MLGFSRMDTLYNILKFIAFIKLNHPDRTNPSKFPLLKLSGSMRSEFI